MQDPRFQRILLCVGSVHLLILIILFWFNRTPVSKPVGEIVWLDPGSMIHQTQSTEDEENIPLPASTETSVSTPQAPPVSQLTPVELSTPPPMDDSLLSITPTPIAVPQPTPKVTPKPTPKPTPKATPKPTPHHSQKAADESKATHSPAKSQAESKKQLQEKPPKKAEKSPRKEKSEKPDDQKGSGQGNAKAGAGTAAHTSGSVDSSQYGWYNELIHDRFYSQWDQPTSLFDPQNKFSCGLEIRIAKDGQIASYQIVRSSGNEVLDRSVLAAAARVQKIDPLPDSLAKKGAYTVRIEFELGN